MKNLSFLIILFYFLSFTVQTKAQEKKSEIAKQKESEIKAPKILKFEPNFNIEEEKNKALVKRNRSMLDTVVITDRQKRRLLKKIFSKNFSKELSEIVTVKTKFEDSEN